MNLGFYSIQAKKQVIESIVCSQTRSLCSCISADTWVKFLIIFPGVLYHRVSLSPLLASAYRLPYAHGHKHKKWECTYRTYHVASKRSQNSQHSPSQQATLINAQWEGSGRGYLVKINGFCGVVISCYGVLRFWHCRGIDLFFLLFIGLYTSLMYKHTHAHMHTTHTHSTHTHNIHTHVYIISTTMS